MPPVAQHPAFKIRIESEGHFSLNLIDLFTALKSKIAIQITLLKYISCVSSYWEMLPPPIYGSSSQTAAGSRGAPCGFPGSPRQDSAGSGAGGTSWRHHRSGKLGAYGICGEVQPAWSGTPGSLQKAWSTCSRSKSPTCSRSWVDKLLEGSGRGVKDSASQLFSQCVEQLPTRWSALTPLSIGSPRQVQKGSCLHPGICTSTCAGFFPPLELPNQPFYCTAKRKNKTYNMISVILCVFVYIYLFTAQNLSTRAWIKRMYQLQVPSASLSVMKTCFHQIQRSFAELCVRLQRSDPNRETPKQNFSLNLKDPFLFIVQALSKPRPADFSGTRS